MYMYHTVLFSIIFYIVCFNMMKPTIYFKFTYISKRVFGITMWIHKSWESFVVINNILSIHSAGDIKNCRYCFCGENIVLITQYSIYFRCCIWDIYRKTQESRCIAIWWICKDMKSFKLFLVELTTKWDNIL